MDKLTNLPEFDLNELTEFKDLANLNKYYNPSSKVFLIPSEESGLKEQVQLDDCWGNQKYGFDARSAFDDDQEFQDHIEYGFRHDQVLIKYLLSLGWIPYPYETYALEHMKALGLKLEDVYGPRVIPTNIEALTVVGLAKSYYDSDEG